jgi:hypothetical protein
MTCHISSHITSLVTCNEPCHISSHITGLVTCNEQFYVTCLSKIHVNDYNGTHSGKQRQVDGELSCSQRI